MTNAFTMAGETALISGGGTGLGLGIAKCFVQAGAQVVLIGRRSHVLAESAASLGSAAIWETHDVRESERTDDLIRRIVDRAGPITVLVNNAGIHVKKAAYELTIDEFTGVLQTHLVGAFALTRAVLPAMMERRHGSIIFTASMASLIGLPLVSAYSAAKAGYLGLVRSLAAEASPHGVRVNAIAPGWIQSEMLRCSMENDPARSAKVLGRTPMNRFGEAEDVGWAATYLCSPAAKFVTGVVLPVDGGASIGF
jgi:NAD(P)-dependent dehydrogenase (short-subunit alcohol dehydrogenase family)